MLRLIIDPCRLDTLACVETVTYDLPLQLLPQATHQISPGTGEAGEALTFGMPKARPRHDTLSGNASSHLSDPLIITLGCNDYLTSHLMPYPCHSHHESSTVTLLADFEEGGNVEWRSHIAFKETGEVCTIIKPS